MRPFDVLFYRPYTAPYRHWGDELPGGNREPKSNLMPALGMGVLVLRLAGHEAVGRVSEGIQGFSASWPMLLGIRCGLMKSLCQGRPRWGVSQGHR